MKTRKYGRRGFTVIELMVAILIGGLLMASLVALSGAVQRSFGESKSITETQANLRFAMLKLTDDFTRTAYMYFVTPAMPCHLMGLPPSDNWRPPSTSSWDAIEFNDDYANPVWTLRGNFVSSRDYLLEFTGSNSGRIVCRNLMPYDPSAANPCGIGGLSPDPDLVKVEDPFGDGANFANIFITGQVFRMMVEPGVYTYHRVTSSDPSTVSIQFDPPANLATVAQGPQKWISPVVTVQYSVTEDPKIAGRWVLTRHRIYPIGANPDPNTLTDRDVEIAEYLLPPSNDPDTSGFWIELIYDNSPNRALCQQPWRPNLVNDPVSPAALINADDMRFARAVRITIRGRAETEDPNFFVPDYDTDANALNYGFDLDGDINDPYDGDPSNGVAHVRVHRSIVQLRNLALNVTM